LPYHIPPGGRVATEKGGGVLSGLNDKPDSEFQPFRIPVSVSTIYFKQDTMNNPACDIVTLLIKKNIIKLTNL
jgi:hypothetical protein